MYIMITKKIIEMAFYVCFIMLDVTKIRILGMAKD
jgi:hypothetical protein